MVPHPGEVRLSRVPKRWGGGAAAPGWADGSLKGEGISERGAQQEL